jgi:hypothetical protein
MIGLEFAMSGCATAPIPYAQLQNYALLVPQDPYGNGAAVSRSRSGRLVVIKSLGCNMKSRKSLSMRAPGELGRS